MRMYFEITDERPPDVSKRKWFEFSRDGMNEIGLLYDRTFKMRHFEPGAAARYGNQPRKPKYQERKRRAVDAGSFRISSDAKNDNIYTGALRQAVRMNHTPQAFPTRVTVNMPTPYYAKMTPATADKPNIGAELTRVAPDEQTTMERAYHATVETNMNELRQPETTRIG